MIRSYTHIYNFYLFSIILLSCLYLCLLKRNMYGYMFFGLCLQGDRIHASVRKTLIYKFERNLKEGFLYSIRNFGVACNGGSFRTSRHEYKINFQIRTKVLNVDRGIMSCSPFSFVAFCDINEGYDTNYLIG